MASRDSRAKGPLYCRKEKSLGVLCTNFLTLYNRDGVDSIGLDAAALQLGVERRRIYDIVNILESIGILKKKAKNQYTWKGFDVIPGALEVLKDQGLKEEFGSHVAHVSNQKECRLSSDTKTEWQEKSPEPGKDEHRKEKSLGLLTRNFVKLFLCSDVHIISLDRAALALLGHSHDPTAMRTKVRRLYDIANVFSSINLIEKTRDPESGKPAFKWIGVGRNSEHESNSSANGKNSKKRAFGTDITNNAIKSYSNDWKLDKNVTMGKWRKDKSEGANNVLATNQHEKSSPKDFVFGPFAPPITTNSQIHDNKNGKEIQSWEDLSSVYRPQYRNPAISDLFNHYTSAWNLWHVEALEKKKKQKTTESGS